MAGLMMVLLIVSMVARAHARASEGTRHVDRVQRRRLSAGLVLLFTAVALLMLLSVTM